MSTSPSPLKSPTAGRDRSRSSQPVGAPVVVETVNPVPSEAKIFTTHAQAEFLYRAMMSSRPSALTSAVNSLLAATLHEPAPVAGQNCTPALELPRANWITMVAVLDPLSRRI